MKRGVRIVNCARGGIVDEAALADAIRDGQVAGAALDVFEQEPPPADHPLRALDQVIATPHLGASTAEAQVNVAVAIAQQVAEFLTTGTIHNAVNAPSLSPEVLQVLRPYLAAGGEARRRWPRSWRPARPRRCRSRPPGEVAERELKTLGTAVLRGLLDQLIDLDVNYSVNYVNAPDHRARSRHPGDPGARPGERLRERDHRRGEAGRRARRGCRARSSAATPCGSPASATSGWRPSPRATS